MLYKKKITASSQRKNGPNGIRLCASSLLSVFSFCTLASEPVSLKEIMQHPVWMGPTVDFVARLAALVPKPRVNLTSYHGVLAPNHRWHGLAGAALLPHSLWGVLPRR